MNILAMDSSDQVLSVALATGSDAWYAEVDAGQRHSELLMECADGLCRMAGIKPHDLNLAACMKGPGSFTGLRIAYSSAKGLALALGIPLVSVPTLDCLAYHLPIWPGIVLPAIDAKKSRFFAALYREGKRLTDYMDASAETLANEIAKFRLSPQEPIALTGSGAALLFPRLAPIPLECSIDPEFRRGRAKELLKISKSIMLDKPDDINSGPLYIRKSDAELNWS